RVASVAAALMSDERLGRTETELAALSSKLDNLRTVLAQVFRRSLRLAGGRASTLYCSFCGKSQHEVAKLIAGPSLFRRAGTDQRHRCPIGVLGLSARNAAAATSTWW